jgi:hypothetical protein
MLLQELMGNPSHYEHDQLIKKAIKKYAKDPYMIIDSAVGLVHKVYNELGLPIPTLLSDPEYDNFNANNIFAVKQLQKATMDGVRDDRWKITKDSSPFLKTTK